MYFTLLCKITSVPIIFARGVVKTNATYNKYLVLNVFKYLKT